jgi:hypothetical protein
VLPRLALIAAAQRMGFTIAEIGTLMHGFDPKTPASARWQVLAARKLPEIEALIARAQGMKQLLEEALQCQCLSLDACARTFQQHCLAGMDGESRVDWGVLLADDRRPGEQPLLRGGRYVHPEVVEELSRQHPQESAPRGRQSASAPPAIQQA